MSEDVTAAEPIPFVSAQAYIPPDLLERKERGLLPPNSTQLGIGLRNACGYACETMKAKWLSRSIAGSVEYWKTVVDVAQDGSTYLDLCRMDRWYQLTPIVRKDQPYPVTVLIWYVNVPPENQAPGYVGHNFGHWILRTSDTTYNDPLFRDQSGAGLTLPKSVLDAIDRAPAYHVGIEERPNVTIPPIGGDDMAKYKAIDDARVRTVPDTKDNNTIIGNISNGLVFDADPIAGQNFVKVQVKISGATVSGHTLAPSAVNTDWTFTGYVSLAVAELDRPPPITPPTNPPTPPTNPPIPVSDSAIGKHPALPALPMHQRLGVHNLHRIEEAREAFDHGCRSFTSLHNISGAREMRNRGAAVIARRFMHHGSVPNATEFARAFGVQYDDTLIVMGTNEADNLSTSDLPTRFAWDQEWALEMHRLYPRCFVVIGSFSMGTPAIENPDVARVFRDTYAQFLNRNADWCGLNYHNYHRRHHAELPPSSEAVQDGVWWPKRFIQWGYDPAYGGMSKRVVMTHDEAGVDIGGIGGAPACGYTDPVLIKWWALHRSWFEAHPQVYVHNWFQLSNSEAWAGYNARCILGGLAQVWQGRVPRLAIGGGAEAEAVQVYDPADSPVAEPQPKDLSMF